MEKKDTMFLNMKHYGIPYPLIKLSWLRALLQICKGKDFSFNIKLLQVLFAVIK